MESVRDDGQMASGNSGTGDLNDGRTYNVANELIARDIDDDGQYYTYVYDAFGRLVEVKVRSSGDTVSAYAYNGLGWRIMAINDSDADGSAAADKPREQYVLHRAGLDGRARSR